MHSGREGMVWELRMGKEKELQKKKKKKKTFIGLHCTCNINLHCKHIKCSKYSTHL